MEFGRTKRRFLSTEEEPSISGSGTAYSKVEKCGTINSLVYGGVHVLRFGRKLKDLSRYFQSQIPEAGIPT